MPLNRANGNVPLERLFAFSAVKLAPLPEKELAETVPVKIGLAGRLPLGSVPLHCAVGSARERLPAVFANIAYGVGVRFCNRLNPADPLTPSLNQMRSCRFGCVNSEASMAVMFANVVSPNTTVNKPFVTATLAAAAGSLPALLVPSLLQ